MNNSALSATRHKPYIYVYRKCKEAKMKNLFKPFFKQFLYTPLETRL